MFLALISTDSMMFIRYTGQFLGIPQEAMMDLYQIALTGNANNIKSLKWLTGKLG